MKGGGVYDIQISLKDFLDAIQEAIGSVPMGQGRRQAEAGAEKAKELRDLFNRIARLVLGTV